MDQEVSVLKQARKFERESPLPPSSAENFASDALTLGELRQRLSKPVLRSLQGTLEQGRALDPEIADIVALAMKTWATERGATHFTHWFQPLTGSTAEKHDSFITQTGEGGGGEALEVFSGRDLIQAEPDASSFPSGGLRATFEARGYTAWDPSSPAFIMRHPGGATLYIPTAFASWTGDALDSKTPLLRSEEALSRAVVEALALFGKEVARASTTLGVEQEYFLIAEEYYYRRPDLVMSGRTLFGARPPRGQELEDHYFGAIPERVLAMMSEMERELYALGIPIKTRHNEVAPGQYEMAPTFESSNVAADHQQLLVQVLRNVARRHGLVALLHEKPFAGVNGSGKHCNWAISAGGENLFEPGDTPHENLEFLFFVAAMLRACDLHQDLLRACVASAGNDHRLGANEAPPAIISAFLGSEISSILDRIAAGEGARETRAQLLELGTRVLPRVPRHAGDRNRTSPVAFTGNKFEFRAVGSSQSVSFPVTVLNTVMAESLRHLSGLLREARSQHQTLEGAVLEVVRQVYTAHRRIVFEGDGYSDEWRIEAEARGLLNLDNSVSAITRLGDPKNVALFGGLGVLSERELLARQEILFDIYFKTVNIEGETTEQIAQTMILPACHAYLGELQGVKSASARALAGELDGLTDELYAALQTLREQNAELGGDAPHEKAHHMLENVIPAMNRVREVADRLERLVAKRHWTMPVYRHMLFVK